MYNPHNCTIAPGESSQKQQELPIPAPLRGTEVAQSPPAARGVRADCPRGDIRCAPSPNTVGSELTKVWGALPEFGHNPQGVTDTTMNPHPTPQQDTVEETEAAGDRVAEGLCVQAWGFPWFPKSVFRVTHLIPYMSEKNIPSPSSPAFHGY